MARKDDASLLQIVDASLAEAARRSGDWLVCHPGCTQCCYGPFPINALDAQRLVRGLSVLEQKDARRAEAVRVRARDYTERLSSTYPGDPTTGILSDSDVSEARFEEFANEEPCPALDPATGTCDLYAFRPMTCRTFGPPIRFGAESVGVCELCYVGATDKQIAACEVELDIAEAEIELNAEAGGSEMTIVAFCLAR